MKKSLALAALTLAVTCMLASCGGQPEQNQPEQNPPAHTHSFGEWEITKNVTCFTDGEKVRYCSCGETQTANIPTTGHTIVIDEKVNPTCTSIGLTEGKHCSTCDQVITEQTEISKLKHTYSGELDATCEVCGYTRVVDCDHATITALPAKVATCAEAGLTEGKICSRCGTVLIQQIVIPTLEHAYDTTYSFDNSFHWYTCKNCGTKKDSAEHQVADNDMCSVCDQPVGATEGVIYDVSVDGTYAEVVAYEGTATKIRIADTYNGLPVTTIYSKAFYHNDTITSIIIPGSVTSIGEGAFSECDSLTSVVISDSVTSIGKGAFECCTSLTSVVIPDSVTNIGVTAFSSCYNLTSVVIPDSVTSIGEAAFYDCCSLTSVVIGDSVTSIGEHAFAGCSNLQFNEYENCKYLGSKDNPYYALIKVTTQNLSSYTIHEDTKFIANYAFEYCSRLTSVVIPDSVTSIGDCAFFDCDSLISVVIPDSVTSIGASAFYNCNGLTSVVIGDSVTSIGYAAFEYCPDLASVVIGDSVTSIGERAFYGCKNLTSIKYIGTEEQWNAISKGSNWNNGTGKYTITYNYDGE